MLIFLRTQTKLPAVAGRQLVLRLSSGRSRSRSGGRRRVRKAAPSFFDDLTSDVRPPIEGSSISRPPCSRAVALEQFLYGEIRKGSAKTISAPTTAMSTRSPSVSLVALAISLGNRSEILSPFADNGPRHDSLPFGNIPNISRVNVRSKSNEYRNVRNVHDRSAKAAWASMSGSC
jgi:hypothetical protein